VTRERGFGSSHPAFGVNTSSAPQNNGQAMSVIAVNDGSDKVHVGYLRDDDTSGDTDWNGYLGTTSIARDLPDCAAGDGKDNDCDGSIDEGC
jgi:hypothetical protein